MKSMKITALAAALGLFASLSSLTAADVGTISIAAPSGTIDSGTVVYPIGVVRNFGAEPAGFYTMMRIWDPVHPERPFYLDQESVYHRPGESAGVAFAQWDVVQRGSLLVRCSTMYDHDTWPANDARTASVVVRVLDVEIGGIWPSGGIPRDSLILVEMQLSNAGVSTVDASVTAAIYVDSLLFYSEGETMPIQPNRALTLLFPGFSPPPADTLFLHISLFPHHNGTLDTIIKFWFLPGAIDEPGAKSVKLERLALEISTPCRDGATIRYSLPRPADVRLELFDASGRLEAILDHGRRPAGQHAVTIRNAQGIYICRLIAGDFTATKKLVVAER